MIIGVCIGNRSCRVFVCSTTFVFACRPVNLLNLNGAASQGDYDSGAFATRALLDAYVACCERLPRSLPDLAHPEEVPKSKR